LLTSRAETEAGIVIKEDGASEVWMDNFKEGIRWKAASPNVALKFLHIQEIHYSAQREQLILEAVYSHAMLSHIHFLILVVYS